MATQFDIGQMLRELLIENVGDLLGERIYPNSLPDDTSFALDSPDLPAIHYQLVDDVEKVPAAVSFSHWYLTCVAKTRMQLDTLCGRVVDTLHRYKSGDIKAITYTNSMDGFDEDSQTYYRPMTFSVMYSKERG